MIKYLIFLPLLFSKLYAQTPDSVRVLYDSLGNQTTEIYYTDTMPRTIEEAEKLISIYEENGPAKLYYSLNRKAWEMADMLNSINMKNLALDDPKDKTFERMRFIINDSSGIANAVKALGEAAGITGDQEVDIAKSVYKRITTPESIADHVNELAGKSNS